MRFSLFLRTLAAALIVVLLPLVVLGGQVHAQTIDNIAKARWISQGAEFSTESNEVSIVVDDAPPTITTFRPTTGSSNVLSYRFPECGGEQFATKRGGNNTVINSAVTQTNVVSSGERVIFVVRASAANLDPSNVDRLQAVITTGTGDRESITIFETGPNTDIFVGEIPTIRMPPSAIPGNCELSVADGNPIQIAITQPGQSAIIVTANVEVLADPFGVVFDSETGEPVSGARVTLVDAVTGQPATVFGEDGVTPWPSTVISGEPITDASGNVYPMAPGEYWFPLTALGTYRLEIAPPAPYTAPSEVQPDQIALLRHPDGRSFVILDASYGGDLVLSDPTPLEIDIPLDRPSLSVSLTKTASRARAQPGDAVFYTITARNQDPTRIKRTVTLTDTPSRWLRLRTDSIRIDGAANPEAVSTSADGGALTIQLGDIAGGGSRTVSYAMVVRADAPAGQAVNRAVARDSLGRTSVASARVEIERDNIASRMTVIGRVTAGDCTINDPRIGIPGVRVMMEDGSFAITDADGRYHFEGIVPGTHVVQAARMTLPEEGKFVDCHRSTRNAGSNNSRFVIGQGGSLLVADFHAVVPQEFISQLQAAKAEEPSVATHDDDAIAIVEESGSDWLALGDGPDGWLAPAIDANPRAPAVRVAIRHRKGHKVNLRVDGEPVSALAFDGTKSAADGDYAVSLWRGVPLEDERTVLGAEIIAENGKSIATIDREVFFTSTPAKVELVRKLSNLIADGHTNPVIAIRVLDRNNRPLRQGVAGEFMLNAPYQSADQVQRQQLNQLTGLGKASSARWVIEGDDGIAKIELAPTMVSGSVRLDFRFTDGELVREQEIETWIEPGDIEWTVVGLAEGSIGSRTVADSMQLTDQFDSDLGDSARVALYAKGRVLGKYLVTMAYDSAKQKDEQRLLGTIDPNAYYTVFADASSRQFDAASREKLYVRIETATFYALYGDFQTGFDQTNLARYNRTATGVKAEARFGAVGVQGFAAEIGTRFRRDEIQGQGISGPYRLGSRAIVANSEKVSLETRDRFRSELVISSRELTRFTDYDIDLLSGTITFKQPVLSRDFDLNPQFIVIDYEIDQRGDGKINAGVRADWTSGDGDIRIGATAITDKGDGARTNIAGVDARVRIGDSTEVRAELAASRSEGETSTGWMVEAQHRTGSLDVLAYARSLDPDFGVGQQNVAELGRRKVGVDGRVRISDNTSVVGSVWQDDSLTSDARRRAAQIQIGHKRENTDLQVGIAHFADRLADGTRNKSTVLEGGVTQRLFENDLELSATSSIALDDTKSIDLPTRHRFAARFSLTDDIRVIGLYEIANGENIDARTIRGGIEVSPWAGAQATTSLGKQRVDEFGNRSFAAFGLSQSLQLSPSLTIDATIDGSLTLDGAPPVSDIVNVEQPVASGGQFGPGGELFEDFTAITLGAAWRKDRWSATARGEYRDGEFANRKGLTFGAIRQLGEGSVVGSGLTWTKANGESGADTEIFDAALAFAHRPGASEFAFLGKLEYRSDEVTNAVAGETGPAGRTALTVTGDAKSRRVLASLSANWSPRDWKEIDDVEQQVRHDEFGLFLAVRHNFDRFQGFDLAGTSLLGGVDARVGIGEHFEIGASGTLRTNLDDDVTSFSFGPHLGFVPADGMLLTVGYNIDGFRDDDFSAARNTDKGVYASVRIKFDADTFGFLGLGR